MLSAIVQGRSGLSDLDGEEVGLSDSNPRKKKKIEQSGPTWGDSEISNLLIRERESFSDLLFHVTVFIITLPGKAAVGLHNSSQQTGETKA